MNKSRAKSAAWYARWPRGQSAVELAVAAIVMSVLLVIAADFGRLYYTNIAVNSAARAAAQYATQSLITAGQSSANQITIATAGSTDGGSGISVTSSLCTCGAGSSVAACPSGYCANNPGADYVTVTASKGFSTIVSYPGLSNPMTLTGTAIMQVQQ
ncbi:MAG: TadE/TadG family type IV pilus assembly protein [Candidatus Binataceae bacterium]